MISFQVNPNLDLINWEEVIRLFTRVKWDVRKETEIKSAFQQSAVSCFIFDEKQIIGFGRTVDDGQYYALIVDVVVDPSYQLKGLGTQIINTLRTNLHGYNFITLTAAPKKEGFYKKIGWSKQKSAFIYPVDEKQKIDHCE